MKQIIRAFILVLLAVGLQAQNAPAARAQHETCAEDNEAVSYPLKGWVGMTNTGTPVSDMTVQAFTDPDKPAVATVKTDAKGGFSFPTLGAGRYYLIAIKKLKRATITADEIVTVGQGKNRIACLVADAEMTEAAPPR